MVVEVPNQKRSAHEARLMAILVCVCASWLGQCNQTKRPKPNTWLLIFALEMMFRGLYDTTRVALDSTVEFFAYRPPQPPSAASDQQQPRSGRRSSADNTVARRDLTPVRDPIARLTRECASLREKLEAVTSSTTNNNQHGHMRRSSTQTASSSTTTANPIRRQLDDARKELSRARIENARLEDRCRNLETALQEAQSRLKELSSKSAGKPHLQKALTRRGGRQGQASQDCSDDSDFSSDAEADEDRAKRKIDDVFLTRTDSWSGAQVLQAVHDLNSEILQFSAAAVETCEFDEKPHHSTKLSQAKNDTSSRLGDNIAKVLSSADHSQDPILVQLALQGCLASCIARALTVFCLGFPSKHDSVLSQIYTHMYSSGASLLIGVLSPFGVN